MFLLVLSMLAAWLAPIRVYLRTISPIAFVQTQLHWGQLHGGWKVGRVNHSEAYSTPQSCAAQVESVFSRPP
jgi:hypothetical protein